MVAPDFGSAGAGLGGAGSAAASFQLPATPAAADNVFDLVFLYYEATLAEGAVTPPIGFTEAPDSPIEVDGDGEGFTLRIYGIPAVANSGTYDFTLPISTWREGVAIRFSDVDTDDPYDVTNSAGDATSNGTTPAVGDTTTGTDRLWVWVTGNFAAATTTFSGGFTKRADTGELAVATLAQASAGPSGSLSATHSATVDAAWLGALNPVPGSAPSNAGQFFAFF
jgi:hypothetical protein